MIPLITGFAAGGLHVFSGVDHLAALAPMALEDPGEAGKTGAYWGFGHGIGVVFIGGLGLWLRSLVDIEAWAAWAEFTVGFLIIAVGVWALLRAGKLEIHTHAHDHDGGEHAHIHTHEVGDRRHLHAALGVGIFHGMAGSGHLFGVLPALALPTAQAAVYLVAYLIAAVIAMGGFALMLGRIAVRGEPDLIRRLMYASGTLAVVVGMVWVVVAWPF